MADFADARIQILKEINQTTEMVRTAYKSKQYMKCTSLLMRGADLMTDLLQHSELYPDDINQIRKLAQAFRKVDFPLLSGDYIITSSQYVSYPNTENFASLCFFMYETGMRYKDYNHQLLRIVGKKAAAVDQKRK